MYRVLKSSVDRPELYRTDELIEALAIARILSLLDLESIVVDQNGEIQRAWEDLDLESWEKAVEEMKSLTEQCESMIKAMQ